MKILFLSLLITSQAVFALEINEEQNFKILSIGPENVVWINLGRIDHIVDREHIKIFKDGKFAARAINVRVNYQKSAWKLYRVVNPELLSLRNSLRLKAIPVQDIAWEYFEKPLLHYRKIAVEFTNENIDRKKHDSQFLRTHNLDPKTLQ